MTKPKLALAATPPPQPGACERLPEIGQNSGTAEKVCRKERVCGIFTVDRRNGSFLRGKRLLSESA